MGKILLRLDAGRDSGLGHLTRNLILSENFILNNLNVQFVIKTDDKTFIQKFISDKGKGGLDLSFIKSNTSVETELKIINELYLAGCDFLILDHYNHNKEYYKELLRFKIKWGQYDYKAENKFYSHLIINPNIGFTSAHYKNLNINKCAKLCVGEKFLLIDKNIIALKKSKIRKPKKTLLIALGGGRFDDAPFDLIKTLLLIEDLDIIIISSDERLKKIKNKNVKIYFGNISFKQIYSQISLAIVSGGVTSQELAFLGVPMIVYPYRENQLYNAKMLEKYKYGRLITNKAEIIKSIRQHFMESNNNDFLYNKSSIDHKGAERITKAIKQLI